MKTKFFSIICALGLSLNLNAATTEVITVETKNLATPGEVTVIVPDAAEDPTIDFPTLYLLNGYSGDHTSWTTVRPDLEKYADLYGMIIVMPNGRDSWYWNWPNDPGMQMESYIVDDLVPYIDNNYATRRDASQRGISGLSMGGHGAMWLAIRHSDIWANAGTMSGGVDIRPFPERWKMAKALGKIEENPDRWNCYTVMGIISQLKPGQLNITIDCGVDDFFAEVNRDLHNALLEAKIDHDYTERPGAHTRTYWANSILYHLVFFNEAFNK